MADTWARLVLGEDMTSDAVVPAVPLQLPSNDPEITGTVRAVYTVSGIRW